MQKERILQAKKLQNGSLQIYDITLQ